MGTLKNNNGYFGTLKIDLILKQQKPA